MDPGTYYLVLDIFRRGTGTHELTLTFDPEGATGDAGPDGGRDGGADADADADLGDADLGDGGDIGDGGTDGGGPTEGGADRSEADATALFSAAGGCEGCVVVSGASAAAVPVTPTALWLLAVASVRWRLRR